MTITVFGANGNLGSQNSTEENRIAREEGLKRLKKF